MAADPERARMTKVTMPLTEERIALVTGNRAYVRVPKLPNPTNTSLAKPPRRWRHRF
jgi:hypothetical protein